mmetsp:Transcript_25867/g.66574  ORF Transcript_25867/g.66574 Transcript_25867/m.66574 type:complete len:249 (+) Transcript_25867:1087-1833(+)
MRLCSSTEPMAMRSSAMLPLSILPPVSQPPASVLIPRCRPSGTPPGSTAALLADLSSSETTQSGLEAAPRSRNARLAMLSGTLPATAPAPSCVSRFSRKRQYSCSASSSFPCKSSMSARFFAAFASWYGSGKATFSRASSARRKHGSASAYCPLSLSAFPSWLRVLARLPKPPPARGPALSRRCSATRSSGSGSKDTACRQGADAMLWSRSATWAWLAAADATRDSEAILAACSYLGKRRLRAKKAAS